MAQAERVIRDIRATPVGVYFDVDGAKIQKAIREKIGDRLDMQVKAILEKISEKLEVKQAIGVLAAMTTMKSPDDLAPAAAEIYQQCRHLQILTDEVAELQQIGRNLFTDELYRLGLDEVKRFGL